MYGQEDGLTPVQLKKKFVPTPTDKGTVTLTAVRSAARAQLCIHRKWYYSPRVPINFTSGVVELAQISADETSPSTKQMVGIKESLKLDRSASNAQAAN